MKSAYAWCFCHWCCKCYGFTVPVRARNRLGTIRELSRIPAVRLFLTQKSLIDEATNATRATTTNGQGNTGFGFSGGAYKFCFVAGCRRANHRTDIKGSDASRADAVLKPAVTQEVSRYGGLPLSIQKIRRSAIYHEHSSGGPPPRQPRYYTSLFDPNIVQGSVDGEFKVLGAKARR